MTNPRLPHSYNILSLDGGGVRGVMEAVFLRRLCEVHDYLLRDVDLLVGTSTGGIIALGLAAGLDPAALEALYTHKSDDIFDDSIFDYFKDLWKLAGADYSTDNLRKVLKAYFGDMKLRDLDKKVAIVTFDLDNELKDPKSRSWKPKIFHNFEGIDSDEDFDVVDVALYTSAAPTYFPSVDGYIDGGVVANNPAMVGLVQALDTRAARQQLENIHLLSLGTGKVNRYIEGEDLDWGILKWGPQLFNLLFEGSTGMVDFECKQLLKGRYHKLDVVLEEAYDLDNWQDISKLVELANEEDISETVEWLARNWQ